MNEMEEDSPVQRRLLELAELLPLTFWRHLDRMNVSNQEKPRWNFLINQTGVQCNIYWENKLENSKNSEKTLQKADDWLRAANETDPETINPEDVHKTIQSLLEIISENNLQNHTETASQKPSQSGEKRKSEISSKIPLTKIRKTSSPINPPIKREISSSSKNSEIPILTYQKSNGNNNSNGVKLSLINPLVTGQKGTKILCYMPNNMKNVKIPIKIQNLNLQNNNFTVINPVETLSPKLKTSVDEPIDLKKK